MNKKIVSLIIAITLTIVILFFFIIKLLLSGSFAGKTSSDLNICNNLKEDEVCVCEKYNPPICRIEKKDKNQEGYDVDGNKTKIDNDSMGQKFKIENLDNEKVNIVQKEKCEETLGKEQINRCFFSSSIINKDINICEKIKDIHWRNSCYESLAILKMNTSLCDKVFDKERNNICKKEVEEYINDINLCENILNSEDKNNCYLNRVFLDSDLCTKITNNEDKEFCYFQVATTIKDTSLCNKITDSEARDYCTSDAIKVSDDVEICDEMIKGNNKEICYRNLGWIKTNSYYCELIDDESNHDNMCYSGVASRTHNLDDCNNDSNCYRKLAVDYIKNIYICDFINNKDEKDGCYNDFNKKNNIETLSEKEMLDCEKEGEGSGGWSRMSGCYQNLAITKNDFTICDFVQDDQLNFSYSRDACIKEIAEKNQDIEICDKIDIKYPKEWCYAAIASSLQDISLCKNIDTEITRDICFYSVAYLKKQKSLCEKIKDEDRKLICYSNIIE